MVAAPQHRACRRLHENLLWLHCPTWWRIHSWGPMQGHPCHWHLCPTRALKKVPVPSGSQWEAWARKPLKTRPHKHETSNKYAPTFATYTPAFIFLFYAVLGGGCRQQAQTWTAPLKKRRGAANWYDSRARWRALRRAPVIYVDFFA